MTQFKVGDKVRRKAEMQNGWWALGGKVFTVACVGLDTFGALMLSLRGVAQPVFKSSESYWGADNFEIVTVDAKPRPQAGEYWRRRDGKVVGPLEIDDRTVCIHLSEGKYGEDYWFPTGVHRTDASKDIIERAEVCAHCGQPLAKTV